MSAVGVAQVLRAEQTKAALPLDPGALPTRFASLGDNALRLIDIDVNKAIVSFLGDAYSAWPSRC